MSTIKSLEEQLTEYALDTQKDLYQFFIKLTQKQKKSLKDTLISLHDVLSDTINTQPEASANTTKVDQLSLCAMHVFTRNPFYGTFRIPACYFEQNHHHDFRPKWLEAEFNDRRPWQSWHYDVLVTFPHYDDCIIQPAAFAESVSLLANWKDNNPKNAVDLSAFLKHPITLEQHIWYVFTEVSGINEIDAYYHQLWKHTFAALIAQHKLDRLRVLTSCLHTANLNFRKKHGTWFANLFMWLEPTTDEIISLYQPLLQALHSPHSKMVNTALACLNLAHRASLDSGHTFPVADFIDASTAPLSSDVKSVVTSTLKLYNAIAKQKNTSRETTHALCEGVLTALLHQDEAIQKKAATLLCNYAPQDEALRSLIQEYAPSTYHAVQTQLNRVLLSSQQKQTTRTTSNDATADSTNAIANNTPPQCKPELAQTELDPTALSAMWTQMTQADRAIDVPASLDDKVFFIAHAIGKYGEFYFDTFLQVLIGLSQQVTHDTIHKLAPLLKRATASSAIHWIAEPFMRVLYILLERYPDNAKFNMAIACKNTPELENYSYFVESDVVNYTAELPLYALITHTLHIIEHNLPVTLLASPTHHPCYIDLDTFIERLACYQKHAIPVHRVDFQVALARLVYPHDAVHDPKATKAALAKLTPLTGEYAALMRYLLGAGSINQPADTDQQTNTDQYEQYNTKPLWLMAVYITCLHRHDTTELSAFIEKNNLPAAFLLETIPWKLHAQANKEKDYGYYGSAMLEARQASIYAERKMQAHPIFLTDLNAHAKEDLDLPIALWLESFIQLMHIHPADPSYVLAPLVREMLFTRDLFHHGWMKEPTHALACLVATWRYHMPAVCYVFLATCLLHANKVVRQSAAELWLTQVSYTNINNADLGKHIAEVITMSYAPMKRVTDLIMAMLLHVSDLHDNALILLISSMIVHTDTHTKGIKKLLTLYLEVLTVRNMTVTSVPQHVQVNNKLTQWQTSSSLKPVIKKLLTSPTDAVEQCTQ